MERTEGKARAFRAKQRLKDFVQKKSWQTLLTRQTNYKEMALEPNISVTEFYCLRDYRLDSCAQPFSYQTFIRQTK